MKPRRSAGVVGPASNRAGQLRRTQWLLGALATVLVIVASLAGLLDPLERPLIDLRARMFDRFSPPPSDRIVIVAIDDGSLDTVQRWPWDRDKLAALVDELTIAGADVIALDLILSEPQTPRWATGPSGALELQADDDRLARAIARHGRVVAGTSFPHAASNDNSAPTGLPPPPGTVGRLRLTDALAAVTRARLVHAATSAAHLCVLTGCPGVPPSAGWIGPVDGWLRPWIAQYLPIDERSKGSGPLWRRALHATDSATVLLDLARASTVPTSPATATAAAPWALSDEPVTWTRPVAAASRRLAVVSADTFDPDGTVRQIPALMSSIGRLWPNLGLSAATLHLGIEPAQLRAEPDSLIIPAVGDRPELRLALVRGRVGGRNAAGLKFITWPRGSPADTGRAAGWQWQFYNAAVQREAEVPAGRVLEPRLVGDSIERNLVEILAQARLTLYAMNPAQRMLDAEALARIDAAAAELRRDPTAASRPGGPLDQLDSLLSKALARTKETVEFSAPEPGSPEERDLPDDERLMYSAFRKAMATMPALLKELRGGLLRVAQARDELRGRVAGRIVFVGWTATGSIADFVPTSISPKTPGVHLHAALANAVLTGFQRTAAPWWLAALSVAALGAAGTYFGTRLGVVISPIAALALGVVWFYLAGAVAWDASRLIVPVAGPGVAALAGLAAVYVHRLVSEQRSRRRTEERFKSYVSPKVVDILVNNPELTSMRPTRKELTILFTDLGGFTTIAERLGSQRTAEVLARYLGRMTEIVQEHGATLDKYIGDAIVAFWGAPIDNPQHAPDACRAVAAMLAALDEMNAAGEFADVGPAGLTMRAGLATGEVMVGDFGNPPRNSSYTVLGDTANLASRLEGANKAFGTRALVSARTYQLATAAAPGAHRWQAIGRVRVKGKLEPIELWALRAPPHAGDAADLSDAAVADFIAGRLTQARAAFQQLAADPAGNPMADLYLKTIAEVAHDDGSGSLTPRPGFDGTITLDEK